MAMNVIFAIISRTPIWVWPLIAGVLWLGSLNLRQRTVPLRLALIFPVGMLVLSVGNAFGTAAGPRLALASWFGAAVIGALFGWGLTRRPPALAPRSGKVILPGSVVPLLVCVGLIVLRYTFGYLYGRYPELRADGHLALVLISGGALLGGILFGRFGRLCFGYWQAGTSEAESRT
jgi:hypothetical protein